jgi:hypothetical protein
MQQLYSWGKLKTNGDGLMYPVADQNLSGEGWGWQGFAVAARCSSSACQACPHCPSLVAHVSERAYISISLCSTFCRLECAEHCMWATTLCHCC